MQPQMEDRPQSMKVWKKQLKTVLASLAPAAGFDNDSTCYLDLVVKPDVFTLPETITHWLVNAKGAGYPISSEPVVIGRHSEAGIPLTVLSASRQHAFVRVKSGTLFGDG